MAGRQILVVAVAAALCLQSLSAAPAGLGIRATPKGSETPDQDDSQPRGISLNCILSTIQNVKGLAGSLVDLVFMFGDAADEAADAEAACLSKQRDQQAACKQAAKSDARRRGKKLFKTVLHDLINSSAITDALAKEVVACLF